MSQGKTQQLPEHEDTHGCRTRIHIQNDATINVYTCAPATAERPPAEPAECPSDLPLGACVPLALGSKPKQRLADKLQRLLDNATVPSVLPAAFFQMARRFLDRRDPANELEATAFRGCRISSATRRPSSYASSRPRPPPSRSPPRRWTP